MGLLDDAIREHLEVKRRLGADADEVARLEREAFGPGEPPAPPAEPVAAADPEHVHEASEPVVEAEPELEPAVPEPEPEPAPREPEHVDQPTRQFTLEELEAAEADGEHDELEETPEFLQETPEHDRLWFEQKPPKDFDF